MYMYLTIASVIIHVYNVLCTCTKTIASVIVHIYNVLCTCT